MKTNYDYIIGIDPDVDCSGFAVFYTKLKHLVIGQFDLWDLFNDLYKYDNNGKVIVRLEAGHHVKSTWHKGGNAMARKVGRNHQVGFEIENFCKRFNIPFELVKPCGLSSIDHDKFCRITGWDKKIKTNPEKRVARTAGF